MNPLRKLSFVLLIPVVLLASTGCQTTESQLDPSAVKWEKTIQQFETADRENPPQKGGLLLAGSSSFRMWKSAASDLPEKNVINRGFGGSQMSDLLYYADRIVLPYQPSEILIYEGDNDVAAGESAETIFIEFKEFTRIVLRDLPEAKIYFVAVKPSPKRVKLMAEMDRANKMIARYCAKKKQLGFIDVFTPMLDAGGQPQAGLFISDQLHMNATGYALWTKVVREELKLP